jgi:hypothetical protein
MLALGEHEATAFDEAHLADCEQCRDELDRLREVVVTGRAARPEDRPERPSPAVWSRISAELGLASTLPDVSAETSPSSDVSAEASRPSGVSAEASRPSGVSAVPSPPPAVSAETSAPPAARHGRAPTWRTVAVSAVAAAILGVLGTLGVLALTGNDDGTGAPERIVARARLEPLPDHRGTGQAELVGTGGRRQLDLTVTGLGKIDGYYEVWLLDADGKKLVSLGLLRGNHGTFPLPSSVNVADYPVVDVSIEPADGNPAHSGDSVVRGQLQS